MIYSEKEINVICKSNSEMNNICELMRNMGYTFSKGKEIKRGLWNDGICGLSIMNDGSVKYITKRYFLGESVIPFTLEYIEIDEFYNLIQGA